MKLNEIKSIVESSFPDEIKEQLIFKEIALDSNAIPNILKILSYDRDNKESLILDMNAELSRAHVYIEMKKEGKKEQKDSFNKEFLISEIGKFYEKYSHVIKHCFNRFPQT